MQKILIISIIFFSTFCLTQNIYPKEHNIILDGVHKFSRDDNPAYSSLTFNDSKWKLINIPGSWQSQGIKVEKDIGWYRIHCIIPDEFKNIEPAVLLGRIGDADEVFFNGVKIGGEGLIDKNFIEASKIERLYKIPVKHIKFNSDNVIAVRVINTYLNGGIIDRGIKIGDYRELLLEKIKRNKNTLIWEFCFFTFFGLFFLSCLFFYFKGLRDKEYFYFWLFITLYGILFILGSVTFYNTGLKTQFVQQTIKAISAILPVSLLLLHINFYKQKITFYIKAIIAGFTVITITIVFFQTYSVRIYIYLFWKILFIITASFLVLIAIKAFIKKYYESGITLLGITGMIFGFVLESIGEIDILHVSGFFLWDYSVVFYMLCVIYALTSRFTRIREFHSASVKIFNAHEKERKRLARELHDGIGTSLLATKLKLQLLESQVKEGNIDNKAFHELVSEIEHVIEELRAVSMDLRPSFLKNMDITEAVKLFAKRVYERSGIEINISADDKVNDISQKIKENIYRIIQEALNNTIRHSRATRVDIVIKNQSGMLTLDIKDNGRGFDPSHSRIKDSGIGLYTIMERVELLGGIIRLKSYDKIGTPIFIEVPVA